ncbi:MAG TPA: MBL fold metallo-hydrolase [Chthoniobacterales bacterium]|jgi:glyoxylase-like metal-dependent hydrolase (beta-lactamase superfamily II)
MAIPLEDNFTDIIGKAQRGLEILDSQLAEKSAVNIQQIQKIRGGELDQAAIRAIAPVLGLDPESLLESALGKWKPETLPSVDGLAQFTTPYHDVTVNAYLAWDPASREAVAFDTGADCAEMLERIEKEKLTVKLILLTHAHDDHIADLRRLRKKTGAPVYISEREGAEGAELISEGRKFDVGKLDVESRLTWGHSRGGMTYVVRGLARPVAIVGDSLFAGSMGGGMVSYDDALRNNLEKILTLPEETILCPGHGPLTTVGEEKHHNPFFAEHWR